MHFGGTVWLNNYNSVLPFSDPRTFIGKIKSFLIKSVPLFMSCCLDLPMCMKCAVQIKLPCQKQFNYNDGAATERVKVLICPTSTDPKPGAEADVNHAHMLRASHGVCEAFRL